MTYHIFPEINSEVAKTQPEMRLTKLILPMDNAPARNSGSQGMNLSDWISTEYHIFHIRLEFPLLTSSSLVYSRAARRQSRA
jgi:hypothetical protein